MVNIINEQQQANKTLIEEIETLKKQLADKEENPKVRIHNIVENVKETESPEISGTLMTLEQHFLPQDELTLENFVKGCTE